MKVLLALQQLSGDGVSRFALDLGARLEGLGAQVKLFVFRSEEPTALPHGGPTIPVIRGQPPGLRRRYWVPILSARVLAAAASADIILAAQESGEGVAAAFMAAKLTLTPVAIVVQNNVPESLALSHGWTVPVIKHAYPRFDRLFCVSDGVADTLAPMGVADDKVTTIPNGVEVERVRRLATDPPPDWLPERPFVVSVGRLEPQKGYDLLIEAYAAARAEGLQQDLVIVGEGQQREYLEALADRLGVGDGVHLPGYLPNPFPVVRRASAFCLSSRYEGYGLVLAEALSLATPVIATDCVSGPRQVLSDGEFGLLVEPESVPALTRALLDHAAHPDVLRAKAAAAAADSGRFSVGASAKRYFDELSGMERRGLRRHMRPAPGMAG